MISATPLGSADANDVRDVDAPCLEVGEDVAPDRVGADGSQEVGFAPASAAATAWFEPLPPVATRRFAPSTVSPGSGCRSTSTV